MIAAGLIAGSGCNRQATPEAWLANSNVLLVVVDTLRADHLGAYGHRLATSPFVDQFAAESITFERAVAPASQTVPSTMSLMTGVYPNRHGNQYFAKEGAFRVPIRDTEPLVPAHLTMLSERLRARGYKTGAIVTNPWLEEKYGFARGFDVYDHMGENTGSSMLFPRGAAVNRAARQLLRRWKDERFFLYLHYMDPHTPYGKEPRYKDEFPSDLSPILGIASMLRSYNAEVRAMDDHFRDLCAMLREFGLDENTLVIFTADHGDEFSEHGAFGHGHALYQEVVHIPLLVWHATLKPLARRVEVPVSLVDIVPTILALTAGDTNVVGDGISLDSHIRGASHPDPSRIVYSELGTMTAALRGDEKVIRSRDGETESRWAFDLAVDPQEKNPVAAEPSWVRDLGAAIDDHEARRYVDDEPKNAIDAATAERLKALGY